MIALALRASLDEAARRWEQSGKSGLKAYLNEFEAASGARLKTADSRGVDLLTGEDISELISRSRAIDQPEGRRLGPTLTATSSDGAVRGVVDFRPHVLRDGVLRPLNLVVLALACVMCWLLARHITRPVAELAAAAESLGAGGAARIPSAKRRDELGELARAFEGMGVRIRSLLDGQRRLLVDISHEIRSPLARLTIAADLLRNDPRDAQSLDQIEREAERINVLVGQILSTARLEAGAPPRSPEPVELGRLLDDVAQTVRLEAEAQSCSIDATAETVVLPGNEEDLRRAIENVLRNAVRHSPPQTRISAELRRDGSAALLTVRDQGSGVEADALKRLFDPFYRSDDARSRSAGGFGLGLTIARQSVEAHGGTIEARNLQPGLEVTMRLPIPSS